MSRPNKHTFPPEAVDYIVGVVNGRNRSSTCSDEMRNGWNSLLIELLNNCGYSFVFELYNNEESRKIFFVD